MCDSTLYVPYGADVSFPTWKNTVLGFFMWAGITKAHSHEVSNQTQKTLATKAKW